MVNLARCSALASRFTEGIISLLDPYAFSSFKKTKDFANAKSILKLKKILIVHTSSFPEQALKSAGMLDNMHFHNIEKFPLETYQILSHGFIFLFLDAEPYLAEYLAE